MDKPTVTFTCGPTGGHIYPAIAIAQRLQDAHCCFIGSKNRVDTDIIPRYGYHLHSIDASNRNPWMIWKAFRQSVAILKEQGTDLLVSTGGYLTLPVVLAARVLDIPIILHEQNTIPGRVNRWVHYFAEKICISFESSRQYFYKKNQVVFTGNPIRQTWLSGDHDRLIESLDRKRKTILIFGGSQGAVAINNVVFHIYQSLLDDSWNIVHITGYHSIDQIQHMSIAPYSVVKDPIMPDTYCITTVNKKKVGVVMAFSESMKTMLQNADVVISRAGATSIAESIAFGKKTIVIPLPNSKDDHQKKNAEAAADLGIAIMIEQDMLQPDLLIKYIKKACHLEVSKTTSDAAETCAKLIWLALDLRRTTK